MQSQHSIRPLIWLTTTCFFILYWIDGGIGVSTSPCGIVFFQFCGFRSSCGATLDQWGAKGQQLAMLSLGFDYLFLFLYSLLLHNALLRTSELIIDKPDFKKKTIRLAYGSFAAGVADAVENFCLIQVILSGSDGNYGFLAGVFASIKFLVLICGIVLYIYIRATNKPPKHPSS
jgi:hypothetical protein